jgi:hypothetical protein
VFHKFSVQMKLPIQGNPIVRQRRGKDQIGLFGERLALEYHQLVYQTLGAATWERMDGTNQVGPGHSQPFRISRETASDVRGADVGVGAWQAKRSGGARLCSARIPLILHLQFPRARGATSAALRCLRRAGAWFRQEWLGRYPNGIRLFHHSLTEGHGLGSMRSSSDNRA